MLVNLGPISLTGSCRNLNVFYVEKGSERPEIRCVSGNIAGLGLKNVVCSRRPIHSCIMTAYLGETVIEMSMNDFL